MSIQNVKTNCEDNEPSYFKELDEYFEENGIDVEDIVRYGEPSQIFIQSVMGDNDLGEKEIIEYLHQKRKQRQ